MNTVTDNQIEEELDRAFEPLPGYDTGSNRALLLPLDRIAASSLSNPGLRTELEKRLVGWLKSNLSPVALEYVLSKLAVTGSEVCVPAVAVLLPDARLSTAARNVLEAIPAPASAKALRLSLPKLRGWQLIGVINSLGVRRDTESVGALAGILQHEDALTQTAAADALGRIGTGSAANALRKAHRSVPLPRRNKLAHAMLACARELLATNDKKTAKGLCEWLQDPAQPAHIRSAAKRLLADATLTRPPGGAT